MIVMKAAFRQAAETVVPSMHPFSIAVYRRTLVSDYLCVSKRTNGWIFVFVLYLCLCNANVSFLLKDMVSLNYFNESFWINCFTVNDPGLKVSFTLYMHQKKSQKIVHSVLEYLTFWEPGLRIWGWRWRFASGREHQPERQRRPAFHGLIKLISVSLVLKDTAIMSDFK